MYINNKYIKEKRIIKMTSISALTGKNKQMTDLKIRRVKQRYTLSTSVGSGQFFRQTLPKFQDDAVCDARSIVMRFKLNMLSTDANCCVDSPDVRAIFSKLRVLVGSTVVHDVIEYGLISTFETLRDTNTNTANPYDLKSSGKIFSINERKALPSTVEYTVKIGLRDSLLCGDHVLPTNRLSDVHIELFTAAPSAVLYSETDSSPDYSISDIELLMDYIHSPSISSFLSSSPMTFHIKDVTHRYNPINSVENNVRLSSNHNSLNHITTIMRVEGNLNASDYSGKMTSWKSASESSEYNTLVNGRLLYEEPIDSKDGSPEQWQIVTNAHPELKHSSTLSNFSTDQHFIADDLRAARNFPDLISGEKTVSHNQDVIQRVRLLAAPAFATRADSFLVSDIRVFAQGGNGRQADLNQGRILKSTHNIYIYNI